MITVIVGTNRADSNSLKVAERIIEFYTADNVATELLQLTDLPPELFTPAAYAEKPGAFKPFSDAVLASDGLHLVVPEYNGGFPGILKYFIDMLPFPESFEGRPVAFTGVAGGQFGALRPVEQLQQIFGYRNAYIFPNRVFIMSVNESLNEAGQLADEKLNARLDAQTSEFARVVDQLS